jgi:hypothetical protein
MPRKQRFKPSRKPKPIPTPTTQPDDRAQADRAQADPATAQRDDVSSAPEPQSPRSRPELRAEPRTDEGEARGA